MSKPVLIPLITPNEPEALLAAVHVHQGQFVSVGDLLCTLETTKATAEVLAEAEGYIVGLRLSPGECVQAGQTLCYLAETAEQSQDQVQPQEIPLPPGLRISQPALALARQQGLDLNLLPIGQFVTEELVRAALKTGHKNNFAAPIVEFSPPESAFDPTAIVVYGGGGHGKTVIEMLRALRVYRIVGIIDDGLSERGDLASVLGLPILGGAAVLTNLYQQGVRLAVNAVGGIGNLSIRMAVFQRLAESGFSCPAIVHPTACVEPSASLSPGVQVFAQAYIGSESRIGFGTIINTGAIVSHDCSLGNFANLSPGAILAGGVEVGAGAMVGMGATVNLLKKIGQGARIGNGATVKEDVPPGGIVRAGTTWPS